MEFCYHFFNNTFNSWIYFHTWYPLYEHLQGIKGKLISILLSRGISGYLKLGRQLVMRRIATACWRLLFCHQLRPCSALKKKLKSLILDFSKQLDWNAKQEDGYYLNYINGLTMISYICLEVKIRLNRLNFDPFFDFYSCLGFFLYFIIYGVFVFYNESTIESAPIRMFLHVTLVDIILIRLIWKSHTFRDRLFHIISCNPQMFELICWALKSINSDPYNQSFTSLFGVRRERWFYWHIVEYTIFWIRTT